MVKYESESSEISKENLESYAPALIKSVDELLEKKLKEITTKVIYYGQTKIMNHGNGISYFNSKVLVRKGSGIETKAISSFTISCFPNCCGVAVVTSNYGRYSNPIELDDFNSLEFTIRYIKALCRDLDYMSLIMTYIDPDVEYFKALSEVLEKEGGKVVNKHTRRGPSAGNVYTAIINREQFTRSEELLKYLK